MIGKKKNPVPKKLSPAMERLVGAISNQGIWDNRRAEVVKNLDTLETKKTETEAHLNRLQGEITATINGILDNDKNLKGEDVLKEAQAVVRANAEAKRKKQPRLPKTRK